MTTSSIAIIPHDNLKSMSIVAIQSLSDPRVAPYRNVKDRELERRGKLFIAEGEHLVRRLLASDFEIESILLAQRRAEEMSAIVGERAPIYVVRQEQMNEILGMKFHSDVMA